MRSFWTMFLLITRRLVRPRRLLALGVVAAIPALLLLVLDRGAFPTRAEAYQQVTVQLFLAVVLPLVALLLSSAALGDERREHTMPYLYLKPTSRWVIVAAALGGSVTATGAIGLIGWTVGWVISSQLVGSWSLALPVLAALGINVVLYAAVFVPLGYVTRWSVLIGLAYIFVWEATLASVIDALSPSSLYRIGLSAYASMADVGELEALGSVVPGAWGAFAKAAVIVAVSAGAATTILKRTDTR